MTSLAERIIQAAEEELGCREQPPGSNRGPCVERYQQHDWIRGGGYPWCVSFAWGYIVWHRVLRQECPYPTASVAQLETWAREHGWAVEEPARGRLCCLNHGQHVTIFHHAAGGGRFAGLGGNQSDEVRISEYPLSAITTVIRVPARFAPAGAAARPRFEVVKGIGERERVMMVAADPKRIGDRVERLLRQGARNIRVRPARNAA